MMAFSGGASSQRTCREELDGAVGDVEPAEQAGVLMVQRRLRRERLEQADDPLKKAPTSASDEAADTLAFAEKGRRVCGSGAEKLLHAARTRRDGNVRDLHWSPATAIRPGAPSLAAPAPAASSTYPREPWSPAVLELFGGLAVLVDHATGGGATARDTMVVSTVSSSATAIACPTRRAR
jgi:hypothetical protein